MVTQQKEQAFVLLELMNHMVLVAQEAKRRGFRVVALNHDPLNPSGAFAVPDGTVDELLHIDSWTDAERVRETVHALHERYDVAGTYAAFEPTLTFEAELRELAGLPNNGPQNIAQVIDKAHVRRKLYAEGLSELRSVPLAEALEWDAWQFTRPAVLKPAHGTGSALCFIVSSLEELRTAAGRTEAAAVVSALTKEYILAHGDFILEELAEGELVSVESVVDRGTVHTVGITGRYISSLDAVVEQGFIFPYEHPRAAEIAAKAAEIHHSLGVVHGPTHLEFIISADGRAELIDFNARTIGLAVVVCIGNAYDIDYAAPLTDIACGIEPDLSFLGKAPKASVDMLLLPPAGTTELTELVFPEGTECRRITKPFGQPLSGRTDQLDVVGMFVVTADTAEEAHHKALAARRDTLINGAPLGDDPNNQLVQPTYIPASALTERTPA
ncbi:ATP-grasp domain-containing protein [Streptomyces syringium]|uniref:ATP-grasp domain-containing protein n=1 Tax=Streptomyces syringium TaxID=76729 RepID=UPI00342C2E7F